MGNPIASAVGAPISGWILDHVHWIGLSSWRWLLILEGIPAVLAGIFTYFFLPNRPADATFLRPDERDCILAQLRQEECEKLSIHRITALQALTNGQIWYLISLYFPYLLSMYTVVFWMPQLIKAASGQYSNTAIGTLVMFPYI